MDGFITPPTRRSKGVLSSVTSRYLPLSRFSRRTKMASGTAHQPRHGYYLFRSQQPLLSCHTKTLAGCRHSTDTRSSHPVSSPSAVRAGRGMVVGGRGDRIRRAVPVLEIRGSLVRHPWSGKCHKTVAINYSVMVYACHTLHTLRNNNKQQTSEQRSTSRAAQCGIHHQKTLWC